MASEAMKRATAKYDAANTRQIHLKLNTKTDSDILVYLDRQESKQGYIKKLIRQDMKNAPVFSFEDGDSIRSITCPRCNSFIEIILKGTK